jgi:hypothetical protein
MKMCVIKKIASTRECWSEIVEDDKISMIRASRVFTERITAA